MEKQEQKAKEVKVTETQERERTISVTRAMIEELGDPKMASIVSRLMEQSDAGTTGKTIFTMAKMLRKQTEMEV